MNTLRKSVSAALTFAILLAATPAFAAKIYLWYTFENGEKVPNYGENPPHGVEATLVADEPRAASPKQTASNSPSNGSELTEQQKALKAKREEDCKFENGRLQTLKSSGSRIRMEMDDGSTRYLTPEEIAKEIKQSEEFIKQACAS